MRKQSTSPISSTKTTDTPPRSTLLKMAEHSEHVLATYKRYHKYLEEIAKLEESRYIMSDTADDTLSIDQVIQTYQSRINDCSVILNWTANHLGLDVSEGVKFRIFI